MQRRVAAVVLAAGAGARFQGMGRRPEPQSDRPRLPASKLLLNHGGRTIIAAVIGAVLEAGVIERTVVVLGHAAPEIRRAVEAQWAGRPDLRLVENPDYQSGQAGSVRVGLRAALPAEATLFCLGDQPLVTSHTIGRLVRAYREAELAPEVVVPVHRGRRGNPVLFDQALYPAILRLVGDAGARSLITGVAERGMEVECGPEVLIDVDTWEDYSSLPRPQ